MATEIRIRLVDARQPTRKWLRIVTTAMLYIFGPIAIGVWVGSSAMQWSGFVMGLLLLIAVAKNNDPEWGGLTIAEARQKLDEIEKGRGR